MPELYRGFVPFHTYEVGNDINPYGWNTTSAMKIASGTVTQLSDGKVFSAYMPVINTSITHDGIIQGVWNAIKANGSIDEGGNMDFKGESTPTDIVKISANDGACYIMTEGGTIKQDTLIGDIKVTKNEMVMHTSAGWISFASKRNCDCKTNYDIMTERTVGGISQDTLIPSGTPVTDVFEGIYSKTASPTVQMQLIVNGHNTTLIDKSNGELWPINDLYLNAAFTSAISPITSATIHINNLGSGIPDNQVVFDYPTKDKEIPPVCEIRLDTGEHPIKDYVQDGTVISGMVQDKNMTSNAILNISIVNKVYFGAVNKKQIDEYADVAPDKEEGKQAIIERYLDKQTIHDLTIIPSDDRVYMYFAVPAKMGKVTKIVDESGWDYDIGPDEEYDFKESQLKLTIPTAAGDDEEDYNIYVLQSDNTSQGVFQITVERK